VSTTPEEGTPPEQAAAAATGRAACEEGAAVELGDVDVENQVGGSELRQLVGAGANVEVEGLRECPSVADTKKEADRVRKEWKEWRQRHADEDMSIEGAVEDEKKIVSAYLTCDANGDGQIDAEELRAILVAIGIDADLEAAQQVMQKAKAAVEAATRQLTVHVGGLSTFVPSHEGASDEDNLGAKKQYETELRGLMAEFGEVQSCDVRVRRREDMVGSRTVEKYSYALVSFGQARDAASAIGSEAQVMQKKPEWTELKIAPLDKRESTGAMLVWHDPKREFLRDYTASLQMHKPSGSAARSEQRAVADPAHHSAPASCDEQHLNVAEFVHLMSSSLLETLIVDSGADEEHKDLALLEEHMLEHHADALRREGLLGQLKEVSAETLQEHGFDQPAAVVLHKACALSPAHRARARLVRLASF
jgi:hypothetical protein